MPRIARTVFAGIPHHITQRGNRREPVFFTNDDRVRYLGWLAAYCRKHRVDILAYCLMDNHVHLVAVPAQENSLERALKPLHMRHAIFRGGMFDPVSATDFRDGPVCRKRKPDRPPVGASCAAVPGTTNRGTCARPTATGTIPTTGTTTTGSVWPARP